MLLHHPPVERTARNPEALTVVTCSSCGTENRPGSKFCSECATPLAASCPTCGSANPPGSKFCSECATPLIVAARPATSASPKPGPDGGERPSAGGPDTGAERRLVSVLFADLVGFTPFAAGRDAEEVRETLTRYFDIASDVIGQYGGTVEKFIGDAVMAVWGAPIAREDDAERAVRAGLELVDAVRALGSGIQARAGVLTGEAAVTIGATNQGMVAGDIVNTASRLQSAAAPGTVLVGEATARAASGAIVFEDAGEQTLKGKASPGPGLARRPRGRPARGAEPQRHPGGAVRRPGRGAPPAQGPVPGHRPGAPPPPRERDRTRRDREDPSRLGVPEVPRRPRRHRLVARRAKPRLR